MNAPITALLYGLEKGPYRFNVSDGLVTEAVTRPLRYSSAGSCFLHRTLRCHMTISATTETDIPTFDDHPSRL
jgi:hypothetical protein